jgi:hypothetical protein
VDIEAPNVDPLLGNWLTNTSPWTYILGNQLVTEHISVDTGDKKKHFLGYETEDIFSAGPS